MSAQSKRTLASVLMGLVIVTAYIYYALQPTAPAWDDTQAWALQMLNFIGCGIGLCVFGQILFHIFYSIAASIKGEFNGEGEGTIKRLLAATFVEDERDKLIALKGMRIGFACAGIGLLMALGALALGWAAVTALHILFGMVVFGMTLEGIVCVVFYERGV